MDSVFVCLEDYPEEQSDFLLVPKHQELLGDRAGACDVPVSVEQTGLEDRRRYTLSYLLFRCFSVVILHSLQLHPISFEIISLSPGKQSASVDEPACMFCFFSLPNVGYLYSLRGGVELLSTYQYPEKVLQAVLTDHLLHVITRNALQSFTVRCAAAAARIEDPYIDTTMKACPPCSLEVCALRMQLFIGLRTLCVYGRHVVLLSTADTEAPEEAERHTHPKMNKYLTCSLRRKFNSCTGICLGVILKTNPQGLSLRHLLSEAHLLLRSSLLESSEHRQASEGARKMAIQTQREELEEAFRQNCAQLGDSFSRGGQKDYHLALPYYRMSGLSVTEVMSRNRPLPGSPHSYGPGFLFYLKNYLLEETDQSLSQEDADEVTRIFSQSEPSMLVSVCASPCMMNVDPAATLQILQRLEETAGEAVPLTITMATMMLRLGNMAQYTELMERHSEMLLVYGFIEEPRLLLHAGGGKHPQVCPTALAGQLADSQPGLLVAAMVALHENNKVQLEPADHVFKVRLGCESSLQVDFWEAMLMASSQDAVIQELLFRLASVYIDRLTAGESPTQHKSLKSADDLISCCSHYGALYPWLTILNPAHASSYQHQEALHKLQSLLCGPSLSIGNVAPLLESLSEETLWGFSLHLLCATRRGQYGRSIERLLDRCPQAIIAYANHQLQDKHMALWWQKLLPELCSRTRAAADNGVLLGALKETLVVVAMQMSPAEFLELLPDDGSASYFLPHLLTCAQRHLPA
uniref:HPS3 biogenesis of lysosomal organelles complex 2 subunit 1 n=1 Tax=Poecilia mexicana TaxID=48701 RepID=A0A3B3XMM2_9TELE